MGPREVSFTESATRPMMGRVSKATVMATDMFKIFCRKMEPGRGPSSPEKMSWLGRNSFVQMRPQIDS